jgi:hypothetical protein
LLNTLLSSSIRHPPLPELRERIEEVLQQAAWAASQDDQPGLSEVIRRLVELELKSRTKG